jgi:hypothetical protein
MRWNI